VDEAFNGLAAAAAALVLRAGKGGLQSAVTVGQTILANAASYYPASLTGLPAALAGALTALEDPGATVAEVASAQTALVAAIGAARLRPAPGAPAPSSASASGVALTLAEMLPPPAGAASPEAAPAAPPAAVPTPLRAFKAGVPKIAGVKAVGRSLKVKTGRWSASPKFSYRWYRNGKAIKAATGAVYKLTAKDRGKRITVRVTATKPGYAKAVRTTRAVRVK
jgi:hypothetical protein